MQNHVQKGEILDLVLGADVSSGDVVVSGSLVGIATTDGLNGETIAVAMSGVYELTKASVAITSGAKLYYSATNSNVTTSATGNIFIGFATKAYVTGDTEANVLLSRPGD